ncbi:hypothetical protein AAFF_G00264180 [Aldrovandia affinis]|uniref:Uncharacterized protein n=1 Tax=Aldrovandia affinis TaxID=143900 RepID=A0AAD7ST89_9TELE|nr:hypothetical protein AAFF_G00264180 [Aldrovandia affinis]
MADRPTRWPPPMCSLSAPNNGEPPTAPVKISRLVVTQHSAPFLSGSAWPPDQGTGIHVRELGLLQLNGRRLSERPVPAGFSGGKLNTPPPHRSTIWKAIHLLYVSGQI